MDALDFAYLLPTNNWQVAYGVFCMELVLLKFRRLDLHCGENYTLSLALVWAAPPPRQRKNEVVEKMAVEQVVLL